MNKISLGAILLTSSLVMACSDSNDTPANETSTPGETGGSTPTAIASRYVGTFMEPCSLEDPNFPEGEYAVSTFVFTETQLTGTELLYTDSNCTQPSSPAETVAVVSVAYPGGTAETAQGTADFIDLTVETLTVDGVALTAAQIEVLAGEDFYDTSYDLILLDGASLYSGAFTDTETGESPETRPTTLDTSVVATRQ